MANSTMNTLSYGGNNYVVSVPYGTCSTAAGTAAKVVTIPYFSLETGAEITVKFTVTNSAANPTLNVNSTGAKAIYYNGAAITAGYLKANKIYKFVYNGTQYDFVGDIDTDSNTKNTTGTTDKTGTKLFLAGATEQSANPTTYSNSKVYIGTDNCLYSNNSKVLTAVPSSGVTAGSYGPSENASPAHSGTFSVPYFTVDATGRVTAASTKTITLPADNNTTYSNMTAATASAAGKAGLVPAPAAGANTKFLRGDATWVAETTLSKGTTSGSGNAVTDISVSGHTITLTKGSTFLTSATDTKNTTGTTNKASTKLFLAGATSQAANPVTYSNSNVYITTDNGLNAKELYRDGVASTRVFGTLVPYGTTVPANANLNTTTYLKVGNYFCSQNTTVATLTNCPTTSAFMMQVYSPLATTLDNETTGTWVYRIRKLQVYTGAQYIQYCYSNGTANSWTYGPWDKLVYSTDTIENATAATTATKFASAQSIELTGDVTGSKSSQAGWSIATTLKNSGVTAGSYGPSANASPAHAGTFSVPYVTVDAKGRVTAASTKTITLPAAPTTVSGNAGSATKLATARTIDGVSFNGSAAITHYGTCSTAAGTAAKVVALTGFTLATGAEVSVKFTVTNSAADPTLNVNSTGAKAIYYKGAAITASYLKANYVYKFVYNGTQYDLIGEINTDSNTKNTTGTTNKTGTKLFLAGATSQASNPVTYSNSGVYIGTDNVIVGASKVYSATVGTSWTGSAAPYTQTITVSGMLATDTPVVDINLSSVTYANKAAALEAYGKIYRITTAANSITVYADEKTTTSISIQLKVVR